MPLKLVYAAIAAILPAGAARAGASLFVDDATITPADRCQVEAWARAYTPGRELTAVPACNRGGVEFGLGLTHDTRPSAGASASLGLKRLWRDFDRHDWGFGLSFGATWNRARGGFDGWNVNWPASFALDAGRRTVLHANLGWNRPRGTSGTLTGGIGLERTLADAWSLLAEAHGDRDGAFGTQIGLRHAIDDAVGIDLLVGRQNDVPQAPWFTVGLNVLLPN